jgi:hypothetical protein
MLVFPGRPLGLGHGSGGPEGVWRQREARPRPTETHPAARVRPRMKKSGIKAAKIIHGYGSTGKGGRLRKATLTLLNEAKKSGLIREFIIGEQWSKFELRTLTLIDRLPQLYKDHDLECYNRGITVVFL